MKRILKFPSLLYIGSLLLTHSACGEVRLSHNPVHSTHIQQDLNTNELVIPSCIMQATSGIWPDGKGSWTGSSTVDWLDCSDGNNYSARCSHRGSGATMEQCACYINGELAYEKDCQALELEEDLLGASQLCCGFF